MSTTVNAPALIAGKSLIDDRLFARLAARIAAEHPDLAPDMPARIMDQAAAFLAACAVTTEPLGPSETVDIGWHTFILYTSDYAAFCARIAGRFIHHVPTDEEPDTGPESTEMNADCRTGNCRCQPGTPAPGVEPGTVAVSPKRTTLGTTVHAIRAAGYRVDPQLWGMKAGDCSQCHAGCHDSPSK